MVTPIRLTGHGTMSHTMRSRRYLTFSLRTFLVLLTVLAAWLGVVVNRAREQREAVKALEALGGSVGYDWQDVDLDLEELLSLDGPLTPPGPEWLRRLVGDDLFQDAVSVSFSEETNALKSIAHLKRLRKLKTVVVTPFASTATTDEIEAALPSCEVMVIVF